MVSSSAFSFGCSSASGSAQSSSVIMFRSAVVLTSCLRKSFVTALRQQQGPKKTRFLNVGGASSLYNAEGKRIIDTFGARPGASGNGGMPTAMAGEVRSAVESLDYLRTVTDITWTFFSPAGNIHPGTRTGRFRLGTEQIVVDAQGRSAISMEDYAVAMLDEIERPQFLNKRFTVGY